MLLTQESNLTFYGIEQRTAKATGAPYQVVILRDIEKFEEFQFFKTDDLIVNGVQIGENVICQFEMVKRGYNVQTNLIKIQAV